MPQDVQNAQGAAPPAPRPGQQEQPSPLRQFMSVVQRVLLIWTLSQFALKFFASKTQPAQPAIPQTSHAGSPMQAGQQPIPQNPFDLPPASATLAWPLGSKLAMHVYFSTSPTGDVFSPVGLKDRVSGEGDLLPSFVWDNISFGVWDDSRVADFNVSLPESVQHNSSLWADIFVLKDGASPDPASNTFDPASIHHVRKLLTRYLPRIKVRKEKNLMRGNEEEDEEVEEEPDLILSHWHKNLTLALISDNAAVPYVQLPPPVRQHVHLVHGLRDETGTKGFYKPIVFPNDFWHLRSQYIEINETTPVLPVQITFQPMSYFKFQLYASMGYGFNEAAKQQGGASHAEIDEIKRMLVETNPYFLGLTVAVSILHMVFEMLAFKSDVSHWRKKDELVGVSLRTIVTNVFVQLVILLYLVDNNENTSWMILMGQGMGMLIEAWKITKAVDISVVRSTGGSLLPYKIEIKDKHVLSEDEKKTKEYDRLAFRYVSYVALPCLLGYTIYSLMYQTHRGWYSFVITTLTSYVYMFGFVQLVPQLIINYKLKSVAHMPMKAMIYKTLSTVVDDFFAFCIKMPILHRLACFRDDVVFLVFLYQRWIYRVDPKRVNEFGQVLVADEDSTKKADDSGETKKTR